jgi:REP element-mobilizing transposase RayT
MLSAVNLQHHRRSIRLAGYDYSQEGNYFITVCTQNREFLFGQINNGRMVLNDAGRMVQKWWLKLSQKFPQIKLDKFIIMPNHIHGIIEIIEFVGANLVVGANLCVCLGYPCYLGKYTDRGKHKGLPLRPSIPKIIQWFKTMSTNEYIRNVKQNNWPSFDRRLWQRNYYEHIIRDEPAYNNIADYIICNPINWENDRNNHP